MKLTIFEIFKNQPSDEVARDDEKDVYSNKTSAKSKVCVKEQHRQNSDGSEAINICPIMEMLTHRC